MCVVAAHPQKQHQPRQKQFNFPRTPMPNLSSARRFFCLRCCFCAACAVIDHFASSRDAASRFVRFFIACEGWHQRLSLQQQHNRPRVIRRRTPSLARSLAVETTTLINKPPATARLATAKFAVGKFHAPQRENQSESSKLYFNFFEWNASSVGLVCTCA